MQSISSYINPNTRGLTSNYKNTAIKDKETYNEAMSQHLLSHLNIGKKENLDYISY